MTRYKVVCGDFRRRQCPPDAALVLVDPPYGLGKSYDGQTDKRPFEAWVNELLEWSKAPRTMIFGPHATLYDWLPQVPRPTRMVWWHHTFGLPRRGLRGWLEMMTPILVYEREDALWHGPTRSERFAHNCIDAHSSTADISSLRKVRGDKMYPKHPAITGTQITKKILPFVVDPRRPRGRSHVRRRLNTRRRCPPRVPGVGLRNQLRVGGTGRAMVRLRGGPEESMRRLASCFTVARIAGPWFSLGLHVHFWPPGKTHIDLHLLWWVFTLGPYAAEIRTMEHMAREEATQLVTQDRLLTYGEVE